MNVSISRVRLFNAATMWAVCLTLANSASGSTVAHWRFEEGVDGTQATGNILDSSGNSLHGTALGILNYTSNLPDTPTPNNLALSFNGGASSRVFIPDYSEFEALESFTLEAWIYLLDLPAPGIQWQILFRGDSRGGVDPWYLDVWDGTVRFTINDEPVGGARVLAEAPALNTWTHLAGVYDHTSGLMQLYIDGILRDEITTSIVPFQVLDPTLNPGVSIGGYPDYHYGPFYGLIDEVRISNRALSSSEFLNAEVVPEPSTVVLLGTGIICLARRKLRWPFQN